MGADYVFDTSFSADLTIMEEATEFLERFQNGSLNNWPMFTSCCPGWLRFVKTQFPEMVPQLSTAKSPQQMFGAVMKTYFAQSIGVDPSAPLLKTLLPYPLCPALQKRQRQTWISTIKNTQARTWTSY